MSLNNLISAAASLASDGGNPEYDRALVDLIVAVSGLPGDSAPAAVAESIGVAGWVCPTTAPGAAPSPPAADSETTTLTVPGERLRAIRQFTISPARRCHAPGCGAGFLPHDQVTEARPRRRGDRFDPATDTVYFHSLCWEKATRGVWHACDAVARMDTREFETEHTSRDGLALLIVAEFAVCPDPAYDTVRIGRKTYFIQCRYAADPVDTLVHADRVFHDVTPPGMEGNPQARLSDVRDALTGADFTWDGTTTPLTTTERGHHIARLWTKPDLLTPA